MIRVLALLFILVAPTSPSDGMADSRDTAELDAGIDLFMEGDYQGALVQLEASVSGDPENADAHAWMAETYRRLRDPDSAYAAANRAIELDPCHAFAYNTLGEIQCELHGAGKFSNDERAWECFFKAVECDPADGSPWLTIWSLALSRHDEKTEQLAIEKMYDTGFFTPGAYEFARWLLRDVPENAVLLTNGDMDTYPLLALQKMEGFRADVTVVNLHLLNTDFFPSMAHERTSYPMPTEEPVPYRREDRELVLKSAQYVKYWIENLDASSRPLAVTVTVARPRFTPDFEDHLQLAGGYFLYRSGTDHPAVDSDRVWKGLQAVDTSVILGPMASRHDRSPVRHGPGLLDNLVSVAIRAAMQDVETDRIAGAREILDWAESFYADIPEERRGWHDFTADMDQIRSVLAGMD